MHRLVLCVVIVGAALAAFSMRDVQELRASSGPAGVAVHDRVPAGCRCEPPRTLSPSPAAAAEIVQPPRTRAPLRLSRPLAIAVLVLFEGLVSRGAAGRFPLGPLRTRAAEAWHQRRVSRGPPAAALGCA